MGRRFIRDERGSQTIELLLLLPTIFFLVLGLMEVGHVAYNKLALQSAIREGARLAALNAAESEVETVIRKVAGSVPIDQIQIERTNSNEEITVLAESVTSLQTFIKMGIPADFAKIRLQAETTVPVIRSYAK